MNIEKIPQYDHAVKTGSKSSYATKKRILPPAYTAWLESRQVLPKSGFKSLVLLGIILIGDKGKNKIQTKKIKKDESCEIRTRASEDTRDFILGFT